MKTIIRPSFVCCYCGRRFSKDDLETSDDLEPVVDEYGNVYCDIDCYLDDHRNDVRELEDSDWIICCKDK